MGTCKIKSAQWREKRDGPSEGVGGHTGTGQAENKMGGFHIFGHTTERSFFFSHKTRVAKCHDSADRERERQRVKKTLLKDGQD